MRVLVVLLASSLLLPGCSDPGTGDVAPTPSPSAAIPTGPPDGLSPVAPVLPDAVLAANVVTGIEPLEVAFTLSYEVPNGAAPSAFTWTFDATSDGDAELEGEGTDLPATFNHTYSSGNRTATLTLTDGVAQHNATLELSIEARPPPAVPDPVVLTGEAAAPDPLYNTEGECIVYFEAVFGAPLSGTTGGYHSLEGLKVQGWDFAMSPDTLDAFWVAGDNSYTGEQGPSGIVPEDAAGVMVCSKTAAAATYSLTMTHPDYVAPA